MTKHMGGDPLEDPRLLHRLVKDTPDRSERARRLIAEGRMTEAGRARLGVDPDAAPVGKADAAEPELDVELEAALRADRPAYRAFEGLPPSHRRQYVRWIMQAKRPETRRRRLEEARRLLAAGKPLGMK